MFPRTAGVQLKADGRSRRWKRKGKEVGAKTENLNLTTPGIIEKQRGKRKENNFYFRGKVKIEGKEDSLRECKECHRIFSSTAFTTHTLRSNGAFALKKICRECNSIGEADRRTVLKNAPPKPDDCANCHKNKKLQIDHIHGSIIFRGWLCRNCNTGIGSLGDNLEGLLRAAIYLEKDKSKIIETLNGIK